jgi:gamma-glutamyl-gamma-aminobutyrate hydrolase PuuD
MRIGITQRVEYINQNTETRDCLDQKWSNLIDKLNMSLIPVPNKLEKIEDWLDDIKCDGYILSGGNDLAHLADAKNISIHRDQTETLLLKYAQSRSLPVLGVCRGFQLINNFLGGSLQKISGHVATRHDVKICFDQTETFITREVNSFHEWGILKNDLAQQLIPCAFDKDDNIEAALHKKLNWLGIMWHPEREIDFQNSDLEILNKLFKGKFF